MKDGLERCKESHGHDVFDYTYIPKRLVDVSSGIPRLTLRQDVLSSARSPEFKYAALSYCWGSGESQAKTTAATLRDRQAGISETEMPPVLQDAIRVTRALGIPFLWIDALCILQDVQSDWEQQCAEMHNIYGSAQVTLCVANSRSCDEGFLRQKVPCIRLPFRSSRALGIASSFVVQLNGHVSGGYDPLLESWNLLKNDISQSLWERRGWVFQEEKLSTRKLLFGRCNLYFECDLARYARGKDAFLCKDQPHIFTSLAEKSPKHIYEAWETLVCRHYSKYDFSSFSYAADFLPALSGLARLFGNRVKDVYYAGHWGRGLYRSLLWYGSCFKSHPPKPDGTIIPSWSALAKGFTTLHFDHYRPPFDLRSEIRVPRTRVITAGDNPFGALKECRLWIRGYTLDMNCREVQVSTKPGGKLFWGRFHLVVHGHCFGHLAFDWQAGRDDPHEKCPSAGDLKGLKLLLIGSFKAVLPKTAFKGEKGESHSIKNDQSSASRSRRPEIPVMQGYGLIIAPTGSDGEFRRVGVIYAAIGLDECDNPGDIKALQSLAQIETVQLV